MRKRKRSLLYAVAAYAMIILFIGSTYTSGQDTSLSPYVPPELQVSNPEIRRLLISADEAAKTRRYEEYHTLLDKALQICTKEKGVFDRGIVEDLLGVSYFLLGKLDEAEAYWLRSLSDAETTSNLVLQADVLVAVASLKQARGHPDDAFSTMQQALELSRKSKSLYMQARVLGELGRIQATNHDTTSARKSLEEALGIDSANGFSWEPEHLLYLGGVAVIENKPDEALELGQQARTLAIKTENYIVFVQSSSFMAQGYIATGKPEQGISLLEQARKGLTPTGTPLFANSDRYNRVLDLPYIQVSFLEGLAGAFEAANKSEDALRTWQQLYDVASTAEFSLARAEAARKLATLNLKAKEYAKTAELYSEAVRLYSNASDTKDEAEALRAEAQFFHEHGDVGKAIEAEAQVVTIAKQSHDTLSQFLDDIIIAEFSGSTTPDGRVEDALKDAESLLDLNENPPAGAKPGVVAELHLRLADLAAKHGEDLEQVIELEKAVPASIVLSNAQGEEKNTKPLSYLVPQIKAAIEAAHIADKAAGAYSKQNYGDALKMYEIVCYSDELQAAWTNKYQDYMKSRDHDAAFGRLSNLASAVIAQDGGPDILAANVEQMGTIAEDVRLRIWGQMVSYYSSHGQAELAVKYASAALPYLSLGEGQKPGPFDVAMECQLAISLVQLKDLRDAVDRATSCLADSSRVGGAELVSHARQIDLFVLQAAGRHEDTKESAELFHDDSSADPNELMQLGWIEAQQGDNGEAIAAWRNAIDLFHRHANSSGEADARVALANLLAYSLNADQEERKRCLQTAKELYQQIGSKSGQIRADASLGAFYASQHQSEEANSFFTEGLKLAHDAKLGSLEALVLAQTGLASETLHQSPQLAIAAFRRSAQLYETQSDFNDEATELGNLAAALQTAGQSDDALRAGVEAQVAADKSSVYTTRYWVRLRLAELYASSARYENSIASLEEAKRISDDAGQVRLSALAALEIARQFGAIGGWNEALEYTTRALPVFTQLNDKENEYFAYTILMDLFAARESDIRDYAKALDYYEKARQLLMEIHPERAPTLNLDLIEILYGEKRYKEAIDKAREAIAYFAKEQDDVDRAGTLMSLAEALRSDGQLLDASKALQEAAALCAKSTDVYTIGRLHYGLAGLYRTQGTLDKATEEYASVIDLIEQVKGNSTATSQKDVAETYSFVYDDLLETLFDRTRADNLHADQYADEAFQYAELNKARGFASSWGYAFLDGLRRRVPGALQEQETALGTKWQQLEAALRSSPDVKAHDRSRYKRALSDVEKSQAELIGRIREASPEYAEVRYPQRLHIADLALRPGELLIEIKVMNDATLMWFLAGTNNNPELRGFYSVPRTRQWFAERILKTRDVFNSGHPERFDSKATDELFEALFPQPLRGQLLDAQKVIIIPDDVLYLFPFEMLTERGQFLLIDKPVEYFPSAKAFVLFRRSLRNSSETTPSFIGVADPITSSSDPRFRAVTIVSSGVELGSGQEPSSEAITKVVARGYTFERLPGSATEVEGIADLFTTRHDETKVLEGLDATKERLLRTDLSKYRYVHFATHGILPVESGISEPALVLSYDGKSKEDMLLTLSEILQLHLRADVVGLSACNTGSGKVTRAEGVASLGSAFLAAGSSSVIMSLWQVGDESTALLMKEFYRNLLDGKSKAGSLAAARSFVYARGYTSPFFWAPFILTGD